MPLLPNILIEEIRKITDFDSPSFEGEPEDIAEAASRWANAVDTYFGGLTSPIPLIPTARQAGISAAEGVFATVFADDTGVQAQTTLSTAFDSYASALALGMTTPAITWAPPVPVLAPFSTFFDDAVQAEMSAQLIATNIASQIQSWVLTGTFTVVSTGVITTWL